MRAADAGGGVLSRTNRRAAVGLSEATEYRGGDGRGAVDEGVGVVGAGEGGVGVGDEKPAEAVTAGAGGLMGRSLVPPGADDTGAGSRSWDADAESRRIRACATRGSGAAAAAAAVGESHEADSGVPLGRSEDDTADAAGVVEGRGLNAARAGVPGKAGVPAVAP